MSSKGDSPTRSPSPPKRFGDESSPIYQSAMAKLLDASWKFDREKNGDLLKTLESRQLAVEQFLNILKNRMNCKVNAREFEALMPLFDNGGFVDGCEFILLFYRLRYEHRNQVLRERVAKEKQAQEASARQKMKIIEERESKVLLAINDSYTQEDLAAVMSKLTEASVKYDRLMPGAVQLDAFDCEYMRPHEFREQLKLVFNVNVSLNELSAYIRDFNKGSTSENINCGRFLVSFFRLGFKERQKRLHAVWDEKKRIQEAQEKRHEEIQRQLAEKNLMKSNAKFTPEEKETAIAKLRNAARLYDKTAPGAVSLKAFEVAYMEPHVFKEQLKRVLNVTFTPAEMGAIMDVFDVAGQGFITCDDFTKIFLNMGFIERAKELKENLEKQKAAERRRQRAAERKKAELANKNSMKVNYEYTDEEYQSAMHKMIEAAWRYDKNMPGMPNLSAFETKDMEPHIFKEQLFRAFGMKVTPPELGVIMHQFDPENTGLVNCANFLKKFLKTGIDERVRLAALWRQHQKEMNEQQEKEQKEKQEQLDNKLALSIAGYDEKDFESAFAKLTEGARRYDKSMPGAVGLEGFSVESLPPHVFKEQLKLVFNIKIDLRELAALMSYFDKDKTGSLNCREFLIKFLRTGVEEREKVRAGWRAEQREKQQKNQKLQEMKEKEKLRKAWSEVDFDYLEVDFDAALWKIINTCHHFDVRQLGPAGFRAFTASSLNPAEFRETMKRTFNMKLTAKELGALITYYDSDSIRCANCTAFLNSFVQIRVRCEEFKGKRNEQHKLELFHDELKRAFYTKIQRLAQKSVKEFALRPWKIPPPVKSIGGSTTGGGNNVNNAGNSGVVGEDNAARGPDAVFHTFNKTMTLRSGIVLPSVSSFVNPEDTASVSANGSVSGTGSINHNNTKITNHEALAGNNDDLDENTTVEHYAIQKYKLRMIIGRKTGKLDLSTMRTWAPAHKSSTLSEESENNKPSEKNEGNNNKANPRANSPPPQQGDIKHEEEEFNSVLLDPDSFDPELMRVREAEEQKLKEELRKNNASGEDDTNGNDDDNNEHKVSSSSGDYADNHEEEEDNNLDEDGNYIMKSAFDAYDNDDEDEEEEKQEKPQMQHLSRQSSSLSRVSATSSNVKIPEKKILTEYVLPYIPAEVFRMTGITELYLCNNSISELPTQISEMQQLKILSLQYNGLESLPPEICLLDKLQEIRLRGNQLQLLPNLFDRFTNLKKLDLAENRFSDFPEVVTSLEQLVFLDISYNIISELPMTMMQMRSMVYLNVEGNAGLTNTRNKPVTRPEVLTRAQWIETKGLPAIPKSSPPPPSSTSTSTTREAESKKQPHDEAYSRDFKITYAEEEELLGLLKSRAHAKITNKLRRRKKKFSY